MCFNPYLHGDRAVDMGPKEGKFAFLGLEERFL